jgi:hypothetical protein
MRPARSILDPKFKYVPAAQTDIRKTFAKYRRLQRMQDRVTPTNVTPIKKAANG